VPCIVPRLTGLLAAFAETDDDRRIRRRNLSSKSQSGLGEKLRGLKTKQAQPKTTQKDAVKFDFDFPDFPDFPDNDAFFHDLTDKAEAIEELDEILEEIEDEFSRREYRKIYRKWKTYKRQNKSDWWEGDWIDELIAMICAVVPDSEFCAASPEELYAAFVTLAKGLEVYSFWGADWETQKDTLCGALEGGELNPVCIALRETNTFDNTTGLGYGEMSLKQLDQLAQQAFNEDFLMFEENWLEEDADEYDLSEIDVTVKNIFVEDDKTCNNEAAWWYLDDIDTIEGDGT